MKRRMPQFNAKSAAQAEPFPGGFDWPASAGPDTAGVMSQILIHYICLVILFAVSFAIFTREVEGSLESDLLAHINNSKLFGMGRLHSAHTLFYAMSHYVHQFLNVSVGAAAVTTLMMLQFTIAAIFYALLYHNLRAYYSAGTIAVLTLMLCLVSSVYVPYLSQHFYAGQGTPNVWHNPTSLAAKPFSFLALILCPLLLETRKIKVAALLIFVMGFLLCLTSLTKPNFVMAFVPALPVYCLLFHRKQVSPWVYSFLVCCPLLLILFYQYMQQYVDNAQTGSVMFRFGSNWEFTPGFLLRILLLPLFPLVTLVMYPKILSNRLFSLSLIAFGIAVIQSCTLAESGNRFAHGNFSWGKLIIAPMLFVVSLEELMRNVKIYGDKKNRCKQGVIASVFLMHLGSGILYIKSLLYTGLSY